MRDSTLRIMIVDDHPVVREGFAAVLREAGIQVVGMAGNGQEALTLAAELLPEMVLMDIRMPVMDGLAATQALKQQFPALTILMLTMEDSPEYARQAMHAGAAGYLVKHSNADQLLRTIEAVRCGLFVFPPMLAAPQPKTVPLTQREIEVLQWVAKGKQSGEIARILAIETRTVETHRQNIRDKLGLRSVAELTRYAWEHDLL